MQQPGLEENELSDLLSFLEEEQTPQRQPKQQQGNTDTHNSPHPAAGLQAPHAKTWLIIA